jgi:predicted nucleic acid-binding protein
LTRDSKTLPRVIIDTSTLFSVIYNRKGNEAFLFELADMGKCEIIIFDYILDEIERVFRRKGLDTDLVHDLLEITKNVIISTIIDISLDEISMSKKLIKDPLDRPIFIFLIRELDSNENSFFVSGDKGFFDEAAQKRAEYKILHTNEMIQLISTW